jgi:serine/threonine protein kinase
MAGHLVGAVIGNYRVLSVLGEGGMGAVLLAEQEYLKERVAIKILHPHYATNPSVAERFIQEAKAAQEIGHDNIVKIIDFGKHTDNTFYLVMELLEGESLARRLQRGAMTEADAAGLLVKVADALVAAHGKGIVHRDLKPDNIFLTRERVKIVDFGIAKVLGSAIRTATLAVLGTPQYMAPEQVRGARFVGPHTDVYALGIILFEMVAGHPPFTDPDVNALLGKHLFEPPPPLAQAATVSSVFDRLVMRCLEKDPAARPTMTEVRDVLQSIAAGERPNVLPQPPTMVVEPAPRRTPLLSAAADLAPSPVAIAAPKPSPPSPERLLEAPSTIDGVPAHLRVKQALGWGWPTFGAGLVGGGSFAIYKLLSGTRAVENVSIALFSGIIALGLWVLVRSVRQMQKRVVLVPTSRGLAVYRGGRLLAETRRDEVTEHPHDVVETIGVMVATGLVSLPAVGLYHEQPGVTVLLVPIVAILLSSLRSRFLLTRVHVPGGAAMFPKQAFARTIGDFQRWV